MAKPVRRTIGLGEDVPVKSELAAYLGQLKGSAIGACLNPDPGVKVQIANDLFEVVRQEGDFKIKKAAVDALHVLATGLRNEKAGDKFYGGHTYARDVLDAVRDHAREQKDAALLTHVQRVRALVREHYKAVGEPPSPMPLTPRKPVRK